MPLSHTCHACGMELCRTRAARDPVYALPVVVCPRCAAPSVRRPHPLGVRWRQLVRVGASLRYLVLQLVLVFIFVALFSAFMHAMYRELRLVGPEFSRWIQVGDGESRRAFWRAILREDLEFSFMGWAVFATGLGVWLMAGFAHARWWRAVGTWAVVMLAVVSLAPLFEAGERCVSTFVEGKPSGRPFDGGRLVGTWTLVPATLVMAIPGMLIGSAGRRLAAVARRWRLRKSLAARRRWRNR